MCTPALPIPTPAMVAARCMLERASISSALVTEREKYLCKIFGVKKIFSFLQLFVYICKVHLYSSEKQIFLILYIPSLAAFPVVRYLSIARNIIARSSTSRHSLEIPDFRSYLDALLKLFSVNQIYIHVLFNCLS